MTEASGEIVDEAADSPPQPVETEAEIEADIAANTHEASRSEESGAG